MSVLPIQLLAVFPFSSGAAFQSSSAVQARITYDWPHHLIHDCATSIELKRRGRYHFVLEIFSRDALSGSDTLSCFRVHVIVARTHILAHQSQVTRVGLGLLSTTVTHHTS